MRPLQLLQLLQLLTAVVTAEKFTGTRAGTNVITGLTLKPDVEAIVANWTVQNVTGVMYGYYVTWSTDKVVAECIVLDPDTSTDDCEYPPPDPLEPCTAYTVTVQTQDFLQAPLSVAAIAEDYTVRDAPLTITPTCTPGFSSSGALQFIVSWEVEGECTEFEVSWEGTILWSDTLDPPTGSTTTRGNSVSIDDPVPYTEYSVSVEWTDTGEVMKAECSATTPETEPSAPTELSVSAVGADALTATWEPPVDTNGQLEYYTVSWSSDVAPGGEDDTTELTFPITGLTACTAYTVTVTASTGGGRGEPVEGSGDTEEGVPSAVTGLTVSSITSRTASLSWTRPDTPCEITSYEISYEGVAKWGDPPPVHSDATTINGADVNSITSADIDGLQPYSDYTFTVVAFTAAGAGEEKTVVTVTQKDVPSAPVNVAGTPSINTITVNWEVPEEINGDKLEYIVRWYLAEEEVDTSTVSETSYLITELLPSSGYTVRVSASNEAGEGDYDEIDVETLPEGKESK